MHGQTHTRKKACGNEQVDLNVNHLAAAPSRRKFLGKLGGLSSAVAAATVKGAPLAAQRPVALERIKHRDAPDWDAAESGTPDGTQLRRAKSFRIRLRAAVSEIRVPVPMQINNGDEDLYQNRIGNYSK